MWMQEPPFLCWAKSSKLCISVCKSDCSCRRTLFKRKWSLDQSPRMPSSSNCAAVDISAPCKISLWCKPNPAVALNLQTAGAHHLNLGRPHFITWCRGGRMEPGQSVNIWIIGGNLKSKEISWRKRGYLVKSLMITRMGSKPYFLMFLNEFKDFKGEREKRQHLIFVVVGLSCSHKHG